MNWYLAKIVYRIHCGTDSDHHAQFDEQLRLIAAENETSAFEKATAIGEQEQEIFLNKKEKLVQWEFINISELYQLSALTDGAELYSRIRESEDAEEFTQLVHRKAAHIRENITHKILQLL